VSFTWPLALFSLLAVPLLLACYVLQLRRKRKQAVHFSSVAMLREAMPRRSRWRRHLPVGLFLAALAALGIASARPQTRQTVPLGRTSIILALDVSRSMCATDINPNRITVAQQAAKAFVNAQVPGTRIGIVAFSGFAEELVPPTTDHKALITAIDTLTTSMGTAIGAAILKSLDSIASVNHDVLPVDEGAPDTTTQAPDATPGTSATGPAATGPTAKAPGGNYVPDIVVLLTDGANTRGIKPLDAVPYAQARHVRVYTIGFGTTNPTGMTCSQAQLGGDVFGGTRGPGGGPPGGGPPGGGRGGRSFLVIDEPTLQAVADQTGGQYHRAEDANQLQQVFKNLPKQIELQKKNHEISTLFAEIGVLLLASAVALSLLWNPNL
jgi:Ca-activated chloride channel homolog